jgi:hypothetical protein
MADDRNAAGAVQFSCKILVLIEFGAIEFGAIDEATARLS